jgi:hypothetical protein
MKFGFRICALALLIVSNMSAQTAQDTLTGLILDSSGAAVPSATVSVTNTETNQTLQITADHSGRYTAPFLRPGPTVSARKRPVLRSSPAAAFRWGSIKR